MMPRLQAEETLDRARAMQLGSGALEKGAARRLVRDLERQAYPRRPAAKATPAVLGMMGIAVVEVDGHA